MKNFKNIFKIILIAFLFLPILSFAQQAGENEPMTVNLGGSNPSLGYDCFQYYKFGSIKIIVNPTGNEYKQGEKIRFNGFLVNENEYPIVNGYLYAQIYRRQQDKELILRNGNFLIDEFYAVNNIGIVSKGRKPVNFEWQIPSGISGGEYFVGLNFVVDKSMNLTGLSFLEGGAGAISNFKISDNSSPREILFDRNKVLLNNTDFSFRNFTPEIFGTSAKIEYPLISKSNQDEKVSLSHKLYKWDNLRQDQVVKEEKEEISIQSSGNSAVKKSYQNLEPGVYLYEAKAETNQSRSILKIRFSVNGNSEDLIRTNYAAVNSFPLKKGEKYFYYGCFHSMLNSGLSEGKFLLEIRDKNEKVVTSTYYSGSITPAIMAVKEDFVSPGFYDQFSLRAAMYSKEGKLIKEEILKYDCSQFPDPSQIDIKVEDNKVVAQLLNICGKPANGIMSIQISQEGSDKLIFKDSTFLGSKFEKEFSFQQGQKYEILVASNGLEKKVQYSLNIGGGSNNIIWIVLLLVLIILGIIFYFMKKNREKITVAVLIISFGCLFLGLDKASAAATSAPALNSIGTISSLQDINLSWNSVKDAKSYKYQICSDSNCIKIITSGVSQSTSAKISKEDFQWKNSGQLYWRAASCSDLFSLNCGVWASRTGLLIDIRETNIKPIQASVIKDFDISLSWAEKGGKFYKIRICDENTCKKIIYETSTDSNSHKVDASNFVWSNGVKYWGISYCIDNKHSNCTPFKSIFVNYFNIQIVPGGLSPCPGTISAFEPSLSLTAISGTTVYKYNVCSDSACAKKMYSVTSTQNSIKVNKEDIQWSNPYLYWQVYACADKNGLRCFLSPICTLTQNAKPKILLPIPGGTINSFDVSLDWSDVTGAQSYKYEIFKSSKLVYSATTSQSGAIIDKEKMDWSNIGGDTRTWKVYACADKQAQNCSIPSDITSFQIRISSKITSPPNGLQIFSPPIILEADKVIGARSYKYILTDRYTTKIIATGTIATPFAYLKGSLFNWGENPLTGTGGSYTLTIDPCADEFGQKCSNNVWMVSFTTKMPYDTKSNLSVSTVISSFWGKSNPLCPSKKTMYDCERTNTNYSSMDLALGVQFDVAGSYNFSLRDSKTNKTYSSIPVIKVGESLKVNVIKPEGEWFLTGGVFDSPPIWWVENADKNYSDKKEIDSSYLYPYSFLNPKNNLTRYPKLGIAATDPIKAKKLQAVVAETDKAGISFDNEGFPILTAKKEGLVHLRVTVPSVPTYQTIDNLWFSKGTLPQANQDFIVSIEGIANSDPIVDAGPDQNATIGQGPINLEANAQDPDGDPLTYLWQSDAGQFSDPNSPNTQFIPPVSDQDMEYTITVTVTDGKGGVATDIVKIFVKKNTNPEITAWDYLQLGSYCQNSSGQFAWTYFDSDGHKQGWFQIVIRDIDTSQVVFDTGKASGNQDKFTFVPGQIPSGKQYIWEITVWDEFGGKSQTQSKPLTVSPSASPTIDFTYQKQNSPDINFNDYLLTDISNCFGAEVVNRQWNTDIGVIRPDPANPLSNGSMIISIPVDQKANVTLRIQTDASPEVCTATKIINSQKKTPTYQEVVPW